MGGDVASLSRDVEHPVGVSDEAEKTRTQRNFSGNTGGFVLFWMGGGCLFFFQFRRLNNMQITVQI